MLVKYNTSSIQLLYGPNNKLSIKNVKNLTNKEKSVAKMN